jgi:seryl-tRNA synthetase
MKRTDKTKQKLTDALDRIIRGRPVRTDLKITPSNVAREADVGRATLYRFPEILAKIECAQSNLAKSSPINLTKKVKLLTKELENLRRERNSKARQYKEVAVRCAQHVQALALALRSRDEELKERDIIIADLRASLRQRGNMPSIITAQCHDDSKPSH